ncbi:MAG: hypothetical protein Q9164_006215, partial [Protoblastenia rupestris]
MVNYVEIDNIGTRVLTITDSIVEHRIPINTQIIKITKPDGIAEYALDQLPLQLDIDALGGRIKIQDRKGQLLYSRKTLVQQPQPPILSDVSAALPLKDPNQDHSNLPSPALTPTTAAPLGFAQAGSQLTPTNTSEYLTRREKRKATD